ncbi:hypothetical protein NM208_g12253 [Fusarium decemcellulare]|uniref:Uncharacterized protein n=1 Tax=Fusarium decemcellulare TaxID=57161 RepID=A0ACC1RS37_9HYPO|nr:hypothetical protein NM208_g12253 [Fusarium decemcellulare]
MTRMIKGTNITPHDSGHHHEPHHDHGVPGSAPNEPHLVSHGEPAPGSQGEHRPEHHASEHQHHHQGAPQVQHHEEPRQEPPHITMHSWDAQRIRPRLSRPSDTPAPPKNMWYEVPKEPPASRSKRPAEIFPWERNRPPPTRTFAGEPEPPPPEAEPIVESRSEPTAESSAKTEALAESSGVASSTTETKSEASTPTTPTVQITPSDPWTSFPRVNAWDEVPEIERYVDGLRGHRRGKSSGSLGRIKSPSTSAWKDDRSGMQLRGLKLTDFPSAVERPSLPVTPAPVHRQSFWSGDDKEHGGDEGATQLPEAEGVPAQSDWDPLAQLQKLAKQQSDVLLKKLGGGDEGEGREGGAGGVSREIPSRPLPFGSGDVRSPTYIAQSAPGVLSPQPVKGKKAPSILRDMSSGGLEPMTTSKPPSIPEPSYSGPGAAWERGEAIPQRETPLLPRDEDLDVLET